MMFEPKVYVFGTRFKNFEGYFNIHFKPLNRAEKHMLAKEAAIALENLFKIEASFLTILFGKEDVEWDYDIEYQNHLDWYERQCLFMINKYKFKWITIDKYYFAREYKPTE